MRIQETDSAVLPCIAEAVSSGRPFRASQAIQGIDSHLLAGLAQNPQGEMFLVHGDSDVTGGGGRRAEPTVWHARCVSKRSSAKEQIREFCVDPVEM